MLNDNLMSDVRLGSMNAVIRRLSEGADINATDRRGMTALMEASLRNRLKMVRLLLENGADKEVVEGSFGCNALTFACLSGRSEVVEFLLDRGGKVNTRDRFRRTALMAAAATGNVGAVLLLLTNGANVHLESTFGATAADMAAIEGHTEILALLLPSGAATGMLRAQHPEVKFA